MDLTDMARDWRRMVRYYLTGAVNTAFGYGAFAAFIASGVNIYIAQIVAHFLGMTFNFLTFSRLTFADRQGSKLRFLGSYIVNYLLSFASLFVLSQVIASPYLAGFVTILLISAINYLLLDRLVFHRQAVR